MATCELRFYSSSIKGLVNEHITMQFVSQLPRGAAKCYGGRAKAKYRCQDKAVRVLVASVMLTGEKCISETTSRNHELNWNVKKSSIISTKKSYKKRWSQIDESCRVWSGFLLEGNACNFDGAVRNFWIKCSKCQETLCDRYGINVKPTINFNIVRGFPLIFDRTLTFSLLIIIAS